MVKKMSNELIKMALIISAENVRCFINYYPFLECVPTCWDQRFRKRRSRSLEDRTSNFLSGFLAFDHFTLARPHPLFPRQMDSFPIRAGRKCAGAECCQGLYHRPSPL